MSQTASYNNPHRAAFMSSLTHSDGFDVPGCVRDGSGAGKVNVRELKVLKVKS